jgi:alpha-L-rhamnosidase
MNHQNGRLAARFGCGGRLKAALTAGQLFILACGAVSAAAQTINPALLTSRWSAHWIRPADVPRRDFGVYHFRTAFTLPAAPDRFVIHASADNRYQLFVNGVRVLSGPARGDLDHWRFDTRDIAAHLRAGRNVVAAVVWNYGDHAPMAQMTNETGLIVQGDTEREHVINTGKNWKAQRDRGWALLPVDRASIFYEYYVGGPGEQVTAATHEWGWERPEFDDSAWGAVEEITIGGPRAIRDTPSRWMLVPREIPLMEETPERFARVARVDGARVPEGFVEGKTGWTISAATRVRLLLDRGHLTVAYPEITVSGGKGARLALTYTEALREPLPDGKKGPKGKRNFV